MTMLVLPLDPDSAGYLALAIGALRKQLADRGARDVPPALLEMERLALAEMDTDGQEMTAGAVAALSILAGSHDRGVGLCEFLTVHQFAAASDLSVRTIRRRIASGELQTLPHKRGEAIRIPRSELDRHTRRPNERNR